MNLGRRGDCTGHPGERRSGFDLHGDVIIISGRIAAFAQKGQTLPIKVLEADKSSHYLREVVGAKNRLQQLGVTLDLANELAIINEPPEL